ncbi:hypothetical protein [Thioclava sp.]|uniref:hypothetical protein n=1 Tax=Thioclava sp. TaxID=1933450 RepID=UPI003AA801D8
MDISSSHNLCQLEHIVVSTSPKDSLVTPDPFNKGQDEQISNKCVPDVSQSSFRQPKAKTRASAKSNFFLFSGI